MGDKGQKGSMGRHGKIGPIGSKGMLSTIIFCIVSDEKSSIVYVWLPTLRLDCNREFLIL